MKISINCPKCGLGADIEMVKEKEPIFSEYYYNGIITCLNCDIEIDVTMVGGKKYEGTLPF